MAEESPVKSSLNSVAQLAKQGGKFLLERGLSAASSGAYDALKWGARGISAISRLGGIGAKKEDKSWLYVLAICIFVFFLPILAITTIAGSFISPSSTRYTSPFPPTVINPACVDLADLFKQNAQQNCVPSAILMAVSQVEAPGIWGLNCQQIAKFSTPNWWENATPQEIKQGYCYDTCAATGLCSGTTVVGPMQFEESTWEGIMPGYSLEDRCRLDLSFLAAAKKIKTNSGTGLEECNGWSETTVRKTAKRYCGSCGTQGCQDPKNSNGNDSCSPGCGYDYCGAVWVLYQQYANQ